MGIKTLEEKFQYELGGIYDAEHQFLEAQRTMLKSASTSTVKAMLEKHIAETEQQIANLAEVYEIFGLSPERITCAGAQGIVAEGNELLSKTKGVPELADLAITGACSKVEHFEIATYRGLIAGAKLTGQEGVVRLLTANLQQEENTAQTLEANMPTLLETAVQTASKAAQA